MTSLLLPHRIAFQPVVDVEAGAVVAMEARAGPPPGPPAPGSDPAEADTDLAVIAARAAGERETLLPLKLTLQAETLVRGQVHLARLHHALQRIGLRPRGIILTVAGDFHPAERREIAAVLARLRTAGYLVALANVGAAHIPLDFIQEIAPYMLKIDPELARRAAADGRHSALLEALVTLGHRIGTHILVPGVATSEQLAHVRGLSVRLAQGPLLAPSDWRPGMPVTVPVESYTEAPANEVRALGPRVSQFVLPAVSLPDTATADEVLSAFNAEPKTTSIVLVDQHQRPRYGIERTRFLLGLAGPYGHALHGHKAAARLGDTPKLVPHTVPAVAALRAAAGHDNQRIYDDLVVVDEFGRCLGVVRVSDLIRSLSVVADAKLPQQRSA